MHSKPRLIAFYLPQFHPIPENDEWWGKGFTEWTNVAKAKPLYPGHYQPRLPADLGFYDLRVSETRAQQANMAREYGLEAFCYYHYWFGGKQLLQRPLEEVVRLGEPDFGFCVCWANQTWTGIWHGSPNKILIEQTYPGDDDHRAHFESLLPAFADRRHIRVDGKPVFMIYRPRDLPDCRKTLDFWREMAIKAGLGGLHLIGVHEDPDWQPADFGFDASITPRLPARRGWVSRRNTIKWLKQKQEIMRGFPTIHEYEMIMDSFLPNRSNRILNYPCVVPNWDNTPRSGANGLVLHNSTPELFRRHLRQAVSMTDGVESDRNLIFIKSWNEWAEGNYLEPDRRFGLRYLEVIRDELGLSQS
jgi:hypothetical protein